MERPNPEPPPPIERPKPPPPIERPKLDPPPPLDMPEGAPRKPPPMLRLKLRVFADGAAARLGALWRCGLDTAGLLLPRGADMLREGADGARALRST
jgi:hypothetical protein